MAIFITAALFIWTATSAVLASPMLLMSSPAYAVDVFSKSALIDKRASPVVLNYVPGTARGEALIINLCPTTQYVFSCGQVPEGCSDEIALSPGQTYCEPYKDTPNNGQSIKVSPESGLWVRKPLLQLEYTVATDVWSGQIIYDVSEVDGNPYGMMGGFTLAATDGCFKNDCAEPSTMCPTIFTDPGFGVPNYCAITNSVGIALCSA